MGDALGMIETRGLVAMIEASDAMVKACRSISNLRFFDIISLTSHTIETYEMVDNVIPHNTILLGAYLA